MTISTWERFSEGLLDAIAALDDRTFLIVCLRDDDRIYVQFAQGSESLRAEAVADEFLPDDRQLGFAGADAMKSLGWVPPDLDPAGMMNWHSELDWPATTGQYRELVEMSVAALRDVYGVDSPNELGYQAWREAESPPVGVTFDADKLEPRIPHLELPQLGLAPVSASS
ncbi:MAG: hypothetical protein JWM76_505 [Pseudonocardiales bacterium]|nr:hypothetical protein [Pseudonocardiales bacterium]